MADSVRIGRQRMPDSVLGRELRNASELYCTPIVICDVASAIWVFEAVLVDDLALESGRRQGFGRVRSAAGPLARVTARGERINMHLSRNMTPSICIARDLVSRVVGRVAPWYTYDLKSRD